jgi:adenylate cyclase
MFFNDKQKGIGGDDLNGILNELEKNDRNALKSLKKYADPKNHPDDVMLSKTFQKYDNIVLGNYGSIDDLFPEDRLLTMYDETNSIPIIAENATTGMINIIPDADGIIRKTLIVAKFQKNSEEIPVIKENFDIAITKKYLGVNGNEISNNIPLEEKGQMIINFQKPGQTFPLLSFSDVYFGTFDEKYVKDRIVLIGTTDISMQDNHAVPNGRKVLMPGVEIHAHSIQTILDSNFLQNQSLVSMVVVITIITLLAVIIFMTFSIITGGIFVASNAALYFFLARFSFNEGLILNIVYPIIALILGYILTLIVRYFTEKKQKHFLKKAFSPYVSDDIVREILNNPKSLKLGGERKMVTVFFADIRNFTMTVEGLEPEIMVAQMNEYFTAMAGMIKKNGGTVDKYEGDGIMAFFGAPVDEEDHALRACITALQCQGALKSLNEKWRKEGKPNFSFRIGIHSGEVIAGNIGSSERFEYTVMGDPVNLASRIEQVNKELGTQILISEKSYEEIMRSPDVKKFALTQYGPIQIRGKKEPIHVYELKTG